MASFVPAAIETLDEKKLAVDGVSQEQKGTFEVETGTVTVLDDDAASSQLETEAGDDALKLAGTHAHHFDDKYYRRLRRKIVSASRLVKTLLGLTPITGPSCHAYPRLRVLYTIP